MRLQSVGDKAASSRWTIWSEADGSECPVRTIYECVDWLLVLALMW